MERISGRDFNVNDDDNDDEDEGDEGEGTRKQLRSICSRVLISWKQAFCSIRWTVSVLLSQ